MPQSLEQQIAAQADHLKSLRASNSDVLLVLKGAQKLLQLKVLLQKSESDPSFDKARAAKLMGRLDGIESTLDDEDSRLTGLESTLESPARKQAKAQVQKKEKKAKPAKSPAAPKPAKSQASARAETAAKSAAKAAKPSPPSTSSSFFLSEPHMPLSDQAKAELARLR
jgi:hypothetical protein